MVSDQKKDSKCFKKMSLFFKINSLETWLQDDNKKNWGLRSYPTILFRSELKISSLS